MSTSAYPESVDTSSVISTTGLTDAHNSPLISPIVNCGDQQITTPNSYIFDDANMSINNSNSNSHHSDGGNKQHQPHNEIFHYPHPKNFHPIPVLSYLNNTQISAISGALAGFLSGVSVCPLDVAKTRLQAQGVVLKESAGANTELRMKYKGIFNTLGKIYHQEGISGLYRGLVPITIGYLPTWMIYFTVYENAKVFYPQTIKKLFNVDVYSDHHSVMSFVSYSLSAMTAGAASTTLTNPIWVVKTRLMLQTGNGRTIYESVDPAHKTPLTKQPISNKNYYSGTIDAFRKMYQNEGIKVFYSGLVPSLFGLFHVAIHFPVYEYLKKILHCNINDTNNKMKIYSNNDPLAKQERFYFFLKLILASSLSKMVASTLTYPHEVLRTRLQIHSIANNSSSRSTSTSTAAKTQNPLRAESKSHLIRTIKNIYRKEGLKGFYSGYCTNLTRTVPSSAVTLVSFEFIKNYFESINCLDDDDLITQKPKVLK